MTPLLFARGRIHIHFRRETTDVTMLSRASLMVIALALVSVAAAQSGTVSPSTRRVDTVNYVLGTQTIGIKYKFTAQTGLLETAQRIQEMGSTILKFDM